MIQEIEETYINEMSILEKYRGIIVIILLTVGLVIEVMTIIESIEMLWISTIVLFVGISFCIGIRIYDFFKIIKILPKVKWIYSFKEYQKYKFKKVKNSIQEVLKKEKSYNLQIVETLLDKYYIKCENKKDNSIENYKWLVGIVISFVALTSPNQLTIATLFILFICILFGSKKIFDIAFDYLLTNKINYNLMCDVLVEIKLDIINKNK